MISDSELLRGLDARADDAQLAIKDLRARHLALFEEVAEIETEMVALGNVLSAVMRAAENIRSGGVPKTPVPAGVTEEESR